MNTGLEQNADKNEKEEPHIQKNKDKKVSLKDKLLKKIMNPEINNVLENDFNYLAQNISHGEISSIETPPKITKKTKNKSKTEKELISTKLFTND